MDRRTKTSLPKPPTRGDEVLRKVDSGGAVSFAGTGYRVGNHYRGQTVGVRIVGDTVQVTRDGNLLRTREKLCDGLLRWIRSGHEDSGQRQESVFLHPGSIMD
jgi:hypothetical protein